MTHKNVNGMRCRLRVALVAITACWTMHAGSRAFADWPQWGGTTRDFIVDGPELSDEWPADGLKAKWRRSLGEGYSQILVVGDRLFTHFRNGDDEVIAALSASDGKTIWEHKYPAPLDPADKSMTLQYGQGPNATPLCVDGRLYALGFKGRLNCIDAANGKVLWSHGMVADFGAKIPYFGNSSSPIQHKKTVLVIAGGITAFDLESGSEVWRNRDFNGSYASPMMATIDGVLQVIAAVEGEIVAVNPDNGKTLWRVEHANQWKTNLFTPVIGKDGLVFLSSEQVGGRMLAVSAEGIDRSEATQLWLKPKIQVNFSNMIRVGELMFTSVGDTASHVVAVNVKTGDVIWRDRAMKTSNFIRTGNRFLMFDNEGLLALTSLTAEKMTIHARSQLLDDRCWTAPSLVEKTLYVRNRKEIAAFDLP